MRRNFILLGILWAILLLREAEGDDQEYRLIRYLMSNYDPAVRPSLSAAYPLHVQLRLSLLNIMTLEESRGVLSTNCRMIFRWNDVHLRWNASDFGGVTSVRIPSANVWRPDILLHNNADPSLSWGNAHVGLRSTGEVVWMSQSLLHSSCDVDLQFFPFDFHTCFLNFTSWSYDSTQVTLSAEPLDVASLQPNQEFHLEETGLTEIPATSSYSGVGYVLVLRRRPASHLLRWVLPCFLINALAACSFCVPPAASERITLALGALIALILVVAAGPKPPPATRMPLLGVYQTATLCMVASAALLSALTLGLHAKGTEPPIPCFTKCLVCPAFGPTQSREEEEEKRREAMVVERWTSSPQQLLLRRRSEGRWSSEEFERRFLRVLDRVHDTLQRNDARDLEHQKRESDLRRWRHYAQITDRVLLGVFLFGSLVAPSLLFAFAPL